MRVYAPRFRSIYLTISTLVVGQETKDISLKAGPATYQFGGKVSDHIWAEKNAISKDT
jgi:hypothetical protein